MDDDNLKELHDFFSELLDQQEDLPPEFKKVIDDNLEELLVKTD